MSKKNLSFLLYFSFFLLFTACSPLRFVPQGQSFLEKVELSDEQHEVATEDYRAYIRQEANQRWLSLVKVPMALYCFSGTKEQHFFNRFMHRIGEAPIVYSDSLARLSALSLQQALKNKGYLHAQVALQSQTRRRRTQIHYRLQPGLRYYVKQLHFDFDNDSIAQLVQQDSAASLLHQGMPLDLSLLAAERDRIVKLLKNKGYLNINNDFLSFIVDTLLHQQGVRLLLDFKQPNLESDNRLAYTRYRLGQIEIVEENLEHPHHTDTTTYRGLRFIHSAALQLNKRVYYRNLLLQSGQVYSENNTQYTHANLNSLSALSHAMLQYNSPQLGDSTIALRILAYPNKKRNVSFEIEGTNTAGDFGGATALSFTNRNLWGNSEQLLFKLRGAYEAITNLEDYGNQDFLEYSGEVTMKIPTLMVPLSVDRLKFFRGATDFSLLYSVQNRPEFQRRVLTTMFAYNWHNYHNNLRHRWEVISLNYVYMPWISQRFRKEYLSSHDSRYALLRAIYENLFIMRTSYGLTYTTMRNPQEALYQNTGFQLRANIETAGNLLYALSKLTDIRRKDGRYVFFNLPYSQYVKLDVDFVRSIRLNPQSSLALHAALGVALAYGNADVVPYEKRYFSGGANSVRGWSVRTIGPGNYTSTNGRPDFINQTGNLKIDLNVEYRSKLFWKFEGTAFIDAGNVWNTHSKLGNNETNFHLTRFWQQIALSYGLGLRMNFNFFILRFDGGMKAISPYVTSSMPRFPLLRPRFARDFVLHFAVGLPF